MLIFKELKLSINLFFFFEKLLNFIITILETYNSYTFFYDEDLLESYSALAQCQSKIPHIYDAISCDFLW